MTDGVSNDPVVAPLPTPISVEPRVAPGEVAESARQAEEARVAAENKKEPIKGSDPKGEEKAKPLSIKESLAKARAKLDAEPTDAEPTGEKSKPISVAAKEAPVADATKASESTAKAADKGAEAAKEPAKNAESAKDAVLSRGEDGKFVSTKPTTETAPVKVDAAKEPAKIQPPSFTGDDQPPARASAEAKKDWENTPSSVRGEFNRAVKELSAGLEKYRTGAERDATLSRFHEMAAKGGTTVSEALEKYTGMEATLRNPATRDKGIEAIFANIGILPREWAARLLNQPADQRQSAADATIRDLTARLEKAEAAVGNIYQERQKAQVDSTHETVAKFAAENPRFEELSEDIAFFLKSGRTKDLAEAYKLAERLNPAPVAAQAEATAPAAASSAPAVTKPTLVASSAQTDAGTRSIAGTPTAGSDPVQRRPSSSIKEAIRRAAQRAG